MRIFMTKYLMSWFSIVRQYKLWLIFLQHDYTHLNLAVLIFSPWSKKENKTNIYYIFQGFMLTCGKMSCTYFDHIFCKSSKPCSHQDDMTHTDILLNRILDCGAPYKYAL